MKRRPIEISMTKVVLAFLKGFLPPFTVAVVVWRPAIVLAILGGITNVDSLLIDPRHQDERAPDQDQTPSK